MQRRLLTKGNLGGVDERFTIIVKSDNTGTSASNQMTIPTTGGGFLYDVQTSDGQNLTGNTGNLTITFPTAGTYTIFITGSFPRMYFNNGGDKLKILDTQNLGIYGTGSTNQELAFYGCDNMTVTAVDSGHFGNVSNFFATWFLAGVVSFPAIDVTSATSFLGAWRGCPLSDFPLNYFDNCLCINYALAFLETNLSQASIDGILVSIDVAGQSNVVFDQSQGTAPSAVGEAAIDSLRIKGGTIAVTGGY